MTPASAPAELAPVELGERLLPPEVVAEHLGVKRSTVLILHRRGDLPGVRINARVVRFHPADVAAFVETQRAQRAPRLVDQLPRRKAPTGPRAVRRQA